MSFVVKPCDSAQLLSVVMLNVEALPLSKTSESVGDSDTCLLSDEDIVAQGLRRYGPLREVVKASKAEIYRG